MAKLNTIVDYNLQSWPYIHSSMIPNSSSMFYGTDTNELLVRNIKYLPHNWIYRDKQITYNFNNVGLRMKKNMDDIRKDFIYFSGTSFTMGIGIDENDRFSELVSQKLNLDMINYSGPTYSVKLQVLSFFNFIRKFNKPKILVIDYPPSFGYTFFENKKAITYYSKHIPDTHYNNVYTQLLATEEFFKNEAIIYRNMLQTLCKKCNIKIIELSFNKDESLIDENIIVVDQDIIDNDDINSKFGRDFFKQNEHYSGHPGIGIHQHVSNMILERLQ